MNNEICPYTCRPVFELEATREHIVPDALGGPNSFALKADKARNETYGATVDARLTGSPLLGMAAAAAGIETRNGPARWKVRGQLVADGSVVEMTGSQRATDFRFRRPVEVDPKTGNVRTVKGFGPALDKELARVRKDLKRKGRDLVPVAQQTLDSKVRGGFEHNLSETAQGLTKIAYLAAVWALGDEFIHSTAGGKYRAWIDAEPTAASLEAAGLRPIWSSMFSDGGPRNQHRIACLAQRDLLLTGVRLFSERLFEITIAVEVPEFRLPDGHGWLATIDATAKTFHETRLVP